MNDYERMKITKLREQGYMPTEISNKTGIPLNTIKSYFKRHKNRIPTSIRCLYCGNPIETIKGHKSKKFCCDRCRNLYWNTHQELVNKKAYYKLVCAHCGKEFLAYGNKNRKYCSRECYKNHFKQI